MTIKEFEKLAAPENRDASASLRGFSYQVYQSLLAWANLADEEALFLEVAEDFDRHDKDGVTTYQVKDLSKNLTLRSSEVIDALNNFWINKSNNPEQKIKLKLLTTAKAGVEQGSPFGKERKGLEVWEIAKSDTTAQKEIIDFLKTLENISPELKKFLETATPEQIQEQLITPVSWELSEKPMEALTSVIDAKLAWHCQNISIPEELSPNARAVLCDHLYQKIGRKDKTPLTRLGFLSAFEHATDTWVKASHVQKEIKDQIETLLGQFLPQGNNAQSTAIETKILSEPIPLIRGVVTREELTDQFRTVLNQEKVLFLNGSTGLGKTTLARILVDDKWLWGSFRTMEDARQIRASLKNAFYQLQSKPSIEGIVLDDLDLKKITSYESELIALVFDAIHSGKKVIITSQTAPPKTFLPKLWISDTSVKEVPYLSLHEIEAMLRLHNLPLNKDIKSWANFILIGTSGHPQLVHARVMRFSNEHWPDFSPDLLLNTPDIKEVKETISDRLIEEITSEDTRRLIYRLSIMNGSFSYETAMDIAAKDPPIALAGESFRKLLGPWIEQEKEDSYRVSPLVYGLSSKMLSAKEQTELHEAVTLSFVKKRTLDQFQISTALFHAIISRSSKALSAIIIPVVTASQKKQKYLADALFWFPAFTKKKGEKFCDNPFINNFTRIAQFKIASSSNDKKAAVEIAEILIEDLASIPHTEMRHLLKIMTYGTILVAYETPISLELAFKLLVETKKALAELEQDEKLKKSKDHARFVSEVSSNTRTSQLFALQAARVQSKHDLEDFLDRTDLLEEKDREDFVEIFREAEETTDTLINRGWINQHRNKDFDPQDCIRVFQKALDFGYKWKTLELGEAATVAISVMYDEYLDNSDKALEALDTWAAASGIDSLKIKNQRAKIFYRKKDHIKSLEIAEEALKNNSDLNNIEKMFTARRAAISSFHTQPLDWGKIRSFLEIASEIAKESAFQHKAYIGFEGDIAFCLWKEGKKEDSLKKYLWVLKEIEKISKDTDLQTLHLHAVLQHTLGAIYTSDNSNPLPELPPGTMSNPEPSEELEKQPLQPLSYLWAALSAIETQHDLSVGIQKEAQIKTKGKMPVAFFISERFDQLKKYTQTPAAQNAIFEYIKISEATYIARLNKDKDIKDAEVEDNFKLPENFWDIDKVQGLLYFLIGVSVYERLSAKQIPIEKWKQDLKSLGIESPLIDRFFKILSGDKIEPQSGELQEAAAQALYMLTHESIAPSDMYRYQFNLFNAFARFDMLPFFGQHLGALFSAGWEHACKNQSFGFKAPALNIPEIEKIIQSPSVNEKDGMSKCASFLLQTAPIVGLNLHPNSIELLSGFIKK